MCKILCMTNISSSPTLKCIIIFCKIFFVLLQTILVKLVPEFILIWTWKELKILLNHLNHSLLPCYLSVLRRYVCKLQLLLVLDFLSSYDPYISRCFYFFLLNLRLLSLSMLFEPLSLVIYYFHFFISVICPLKYMFNLVIYIVCWDIII